MGKWDLGKFEEDPAPDDAEDNNLFKVELDCLRGRNIKKLRLDSIIGFHHVNNGEDSPISEKIDWIKQESLGVKELFNVKTWNKILSIGEQHTNLDLSCSLTDLELSVYKSWQDLSEEDTVQTFWASIKPGNCLTLNMTDLEKLAIRSTYRPLPIYYFDHAK